MFIGLAQALCFVFVLPPSFLLSVQISSES